jgi:hypothetical protein
MERSMSSNRRTLPGPDATQTRSRASRALSCPWFSAVARAACLAIAVGCLLLSGCSTTGGMRELSLPMELKSGKASLTEAVENDPFPEASEVNLLHRAS